jgi:hypothetical protein
MANAGDSALLPAKLSLPIQRLVMKVTLLAAVTLVLATVAGHAQVRGTRAGSAEAQKRIDDYRDRQLDQQAQYERAVATGRDLFGKDKRWGHKEFAGTLEGKQPPDFKIGDRGYTAAIFKAVEKVSDSEYLVRSIYKGSPDMLVRGLEMSKVTDGVEFVLLHPVVIEKTYSYVAASGAKRTVLVLERDAEKEAKVEPKKDASPDEPKKTGAAGYDRFPEPERSRLVKVWESERDALKKAIEDDKVRLANAKTPQERKKYSDYITQYTEKLRKHEINDPPYGVEK